MDHLFYLTEVHGQRLTGSPNYKKAAEWVVTQLKKMGLKNARLEKWGPFGRAWQNERFAAHLLEPSYQPLIGFPLAWSNSTDGIVTGEAVLAVIRTEEEMASWKGKLKGKIVLTEAPRDIQLLDKPFSSRYTDKEPALATLLNPRSSPRLGFSTPWAWWSPCPARPPPRPSSTPPGIFARICGSSSERATTLWAAGLLAACATHVVDEEVTVGRVLSTAALRSFRLSGARSGGRRT